MNQQLENAIGATAANARVVFGNDQLFTAITKELQRMKPAVGNLSVADVSGFERFLEGFRSNLNDATGLSSVPDPLWKYLFAIKYLVIDDSVSENLISMGIQIDGMSFDLILNQYYLYLSQFVNRYVQPDRMQYTYRWKRIYEFMEKQKCVNSEFTLSSGLIRASARNPMYNIVAIFQDHGIVEIIDFDTGKRVQTLFQPVFYRDDVDNIPEDETPLIKFSNNGNVLAIYCTSIDARQIYTVNTYDGVRYSNPKYHRIILEDEEVQEVKNLEFNSDNTLLVATVNNVLNVIQLNNRNTERIQFGTPVQLLRFHPNIPSLLYGIFEDDNIRTYSIQGRVLSQPIPFDGLLRFKFSNTTGNLFVLTRNMLLEYNPDDLNNAPKLIDLSGIVVNFAIHPVRNELVVLKFDPAQDDVSTKLSIVNLDNNMIQEKFSYIFTATSELRFLPEDANDAELFYNSTGDKIALIRNLNIEFLIYNGEQVLIACSISGCIENASLKCRTCLEAYFCSEDCGEDHVKNCSK